MLIAVLMILLFTYLDKGLAWMECCGSLQLVHRGTSYLHVQLGVICYCCWYFAGDVQLVISKEDADLHQSLSNVSDFGNKNLVYVDCSR
jgi:hypothetical protein